MKKTIDEIQDEFLEAVGAGNATLVKKFIQEGVDIDCCNFYGKTALIIATERGHKECIDILLAANANPNITDFEGMIPLSIAILQGHNECIKSIIKAY